MVQTKPPGNHQTYGPVTSGHLMRSADGCSEHEEGLFDFFQNTKKVWFMWWLIFSCKGSQCSHVVRFYLIKFHLNSYLNLQFNYFNFSVNSVVDTHILKTFFKVCGKCRNMIILFNGFWSKVFCCFFYLLFFFREAQCFLFEMKYVFMLFLYQLLQLFLLFFKYYIIFSKHFLEWDVKVRFWKKWWRWCRNFGGFSRDNNVLTGSGLCVFGGIHNEDYRFCLYRRLLCFCLKNRILGKVVVIIR